MDCFAFLSKKMLLCRTITLDVSGTRMQKRDSSRMLFIWIFFCRHCRFTGQQEKVGDRLYSSVTFPQAHEHSDNSL